MRSAHFETSARKLRHEALGRACGEEGIRSLLLAHHADDQAETVLLRLAFYRGALGLQGIKPIGAIPECFGIYGVHQSGHPGGEAKTEPRSQSGNFLDNRMIDFEGGGVMIHRPLLGFSKERLVATCLKSGTQWFEDPTNSDITLTPRNTIRYLLAKDRLPRALCKPALLTISKEMHQQAVERATKVDLLLGKCQVIMFDTRSGGLVVRFPKGIWDDKDLPEADRELARAGAWCTAAELLRRLTELVTPSESLTLSTIQQPVGMLFPELDAVGGLSSAQRAARQINRLTAGSVDFRRVHSPLGARERAARRDLDPDYVWVLTRQLHSASRSTKPIIDIPPAQTNESRFGKEDEVSGRAALGSSRSKKYWSPWHLWDGRFWIRIMNPTGHRVRIRPLVATDMKSFRLRLRSERCRKHFDEFLAHVAPGDVRYTLPVISNGKQKDDRALALPSLGIARESRSLMDLRWQIRYKKVDLDGIGLL